MENFERLGELGIEFCDESSIFADEIKGECQELIVLGVKFRVPAFVVKSSWFDKHTSTPKILQDEFYDYDDYGAGKKCFYYRTRKLVDFTGIESVKQECTNLSKQSHCYIEEYFPREQFPPQLILSYRFERREFKIGEVEVKLDKVINPVNYELVTVSSRKRIARHEVSDSISSLVADIVDTLVLLTKECNDDQAPREKSSNPTEVLKKCFTNHLFPAYTKFMFVLQCMDNEVYDDIYKQHDCLSKLIHSYAEKAITGEIQSKDSLVRRYVWDSTVYPFSFYSKLNAGKSYLETLALNSDLEDILAETELERKRFESNPNTVVEFFDIDY